MLNNGCNDFLLGVHCVEEGDRIPPLQSYGQALKQKDCFSGVLMMTVVPISWTSSIAMSSHVPAVSMATLLLFFFNPRYLFPREI